MYSFEIPKKAGIWFWLKLCQNFVGLVLSFKFYIILLNLTEKNPVWSIFDFYDWTCENNLLSYFLEEVSLNLELNNNWQYLP